MPSTPAWIAYLPWSTTSHAHLPWAPSMRASLRPSARSRRVTHARCQVICVYAYHIISYHIISRCRCETHGGAVGGWVCRAWRHLRPSGRSSTTQTAIITPPTAASMHCAPQCARHPLLWFHRLLLCFPPARLLRFPLSAMFFISCVFFNQHCFYQLCCTSCNTSTQPARCESLPRTRQRASIPTLRS